jgi:Protease inhibitor Inh
MALMLAACAGDPNAAPLAAASMAGRWTLAAPNAPSCSMTFAQAPAQSDQGAILPDGGCPGELFKSRGWVLAHGSLTIADDQNQPLAVLKLADNGFQGTSTAGMPIKLTRQGPP